MESLSVAQNIKPTFNLLRLTFGIVPIVAGLDKFTDLLVQWEQYLHPGLVDLLPFAPHTFMTVSYTHLDVYKRQMYYALKK